MKTPALCIFLLGSFLGSLAGTEEAFATGGVYANYLRTSGNSPAQIQAEVNSRSLALELLSNLGIDLEKTPKVKCTVEMQILNDSAFKVTGCGISDVDVATTQTLERMIQTYVRSRAIGMTRAVATARTLLIHAPAKEEPRSARKPAPAPQGGAAAIAKAFDLPVRMIRPISELDFLFRQDPKVRENFLFEDGDIAIFCSVAPIDNVPFDCLLIDRRLVENPGVRATFEKIQPTIERRRQALMDELGLTNLPGKEAISREQKLFWRATRESFATLGIHLLPTDQMLQFGITISIK